MSEKPHLSISALNMLSRCGEQYRRRYVEGDKVPPGIAALVGRGVDHSVNGNLNNKIETGELLPAEAVRDSARDAVIRGWEAGEVLLNDDEAANPAAAKGAAVDKAIRLSGLHASDLAPALEPTVVQRKWTLELEGFPFDLLGYTDVEEGTKSVRDTKTSGRTPAADAADTSNQLTMYALAKRQIDGQAPARVVLDYLVDTKQPKTVSLESTRADEDFRVMLNRIEVAAAAIEKQVFIPANQDDWICSRRWCGYYDSCPFARRSARPQS